SEKGPEITIVFQSAEGLEAGKTKVQFKHVEVGKVTDIELDTETEQVVVTAEMQKGAEVYMTDETRFWVVRARVAAGEVTGLGTLFSGAYIGCSPSKEGKPTRQFKGLEKPPVLTGHMPGRHFLLESASLGSLDIGSPVYYRGIKVGQVVEFGFDESAEAVDIGIFVNAPYHEKIRQNTRFWNAGGIDFTLDTEGVRVDTQSLVSILLGGIAFDLPDHLTPADQAEDDRIFQLYENREDIEERAYQVKRYYLMYFDQNVRGLAPGAPVEIRGIKIGEVVDVKLEVNMDEVTARVAVLALIEPERIDTVIEGTVASSGAKNIAPEEETVENMVRLVDKGLRAQLKTGNLLTGQLYVDLDFYPDAPPEAVTTRNDHPVMPTLPAPFEQMAQRVNNILKEVEKMPLREIARDLHKAIKALHETLEEAGQVAGGINGEVLPELKAALDDFQTTMSGIDKTLGPDSALNYNARNVMSEMAATVRSLRALIDYVERNPQAVIFGKEAE
ncbi:MlaD family protein, partial [Desulfuromonas sp.]|uniref:PqiB family protein n=1 Tax=Desulfuromonas sp. TaxID=892 RepID=UPI0025C49FC0